MADYVVFFRTRGLNCYEFVAQLREGGEKQAVCKHWIEFLHAFCVTLARSPYLQPESQVWACLCIMRKLRISLSPTAAASAGVCSFVCKSSCVYVIMMGTVCACVCLST